MSYFNGFISQFIMQCLKFGHDFFCVDCNGFLEQLRYKHKASFLLPLKGGAYHERY